MSGRVLLFIFMLQIWTSAGQSVMKMTQEYWNEADTNEMGPRSNFSFASYYTDHMVLQRAPKRAVIWGYSSDIGETITVKVSNGDLYKATVYVDPTYGYGVWKVKLKPEASKESFTITALSGALTIELTDVLFGDVWICSGQSNMQFTVDQGYNKSQEIAYAKNFPDVRLFQVKLINSSVPVADLIGTVKPWFGPGQAGIGGFSAVCWFYGRELNKNLGYPIGLIDTSWGGTAIEPWSSPDALSTCGLDSQYFKEQAKLNADFYPSESLKYIPKAPSSTWNSMIHPFLNMTIYGAIWYQGETNTEVNMNKYNCTFPAMIDDWREKFNNGSGETDPQFPFGFVQLGPKDAESAKPGYPIIRWHQTADYGYVPNNRMRNVFMAVANDLSDFAGPYGSVHIRDKQDVAARLVLGGLNVAYKKNTIFQGPLPSAIEEVSERITLTYTAKLKFKNMEGFEALCPVKNSSITFWTPIPIMMPLGATSIRLYPGVCGSDLKILGLRYNWRESPCAFKTCTVYLAENPLIPGPPFVVYRNTALNADHVNSVGWITSR